MRMLKSAFTLIELLVVIAIIAILAAILFPVFAQAKLAAKGAASLSNNKQLSLAIIMYSTDYDDTLPLDQTWGDWTSPLWYGSLASTWRVWSWDILPYMKTADILEDPMTTANPVAWDWPLGTYAYNPQYGYNYMYLSPSDWGVVNDQGDMTRTGISATAPAQPAGTVLVTGMWNKGYSMSYWGWVQYMMTGISVDAPDCWWVPPACVYGWGYDAFWSDSVVGGNNEEGARTGFVSMRKGGTMSNTSFVDGHAKYTSAGVLGAGTNWNWNAPAGVQIQAATVDKYLWDRE